MSFTVDLGGIYFDDIDEAAVVGLFLVNQEPAPSGTEAALGTNIYLEILSTDTGEAVDAATVHVTVQIGAAAATNAYVGGAFVAPYNGGASALAVITGGVSVLIDPTFLFTTEDVITVRVRADSAAPASHSLDESYSFTIEDLVAPELLSAQATGPQTIRVVFNEAMLAEDATAAGDVLNPDMHLLSYNQQDPNIAAVTASVSAVTQITAVTYDLTTDMILSFDKPYLISAEGIADDSAAGNTVTPPTHEIAFQSWKPPSWPANRQFDIYSMFSQHDHTQDTSGHLERTCSLLQDVVDIQLWLMDEYPTIWDIDKAPEDHVDAMLADLGNPFDFDLTLLEKRKLLDLLVPIYQQKGTARGIINAARFFIGIEITAIVPYLSDSWILGDSYAGILGETTWLAPSNQAAYYSFYVIVDQVLTDEERVQLISIINEIKAAHEHAFIVEPATPVFIDHWDLGMSHLGDNTYLHA